MDGVYRVNAVLLNLGSFKICHCLTHACTVFQAGVHKVNAHRAFLAVFSDYFAALLGGGMNESAQSEVTLRDIDGESFARIIDFAYTGCITISQDTVESLLETANYLGVEQVMRACSTYLCDRLDFHNAVPVLKKADDLGLQSLVTKVQ